MSLPPQVQSLVDAVSALPGVAGCFCRPRSLAQFDSSHLSLPGEFGDLPQAIIRRTNGGRENEVMLQVEVIPAALSSKPGEAAFRVFDSAGAGLNHLAPTEGESGGLETVALTTLDAALIPHDRGRLALIKLLLIVFFLGGSLLVLTYLLRT